MHNVSKTPIDSRFRISKKSLSAGSENLWKLWIWIWPLKRLIYDWQSALVFYETHHIFENLYPTACLCQKLTLVFYIFWIVLGNDILSGFLKGKIIFFWWFPLIVDRVSFIFYFHGLIFDCADFFGVFERIGNRNSSWIKTLLGWHRI